LNKAIITIVAGEKYNKIWLRTRPFFENYADKVGADLIVLEDASFVPSPHWLKFSIYEFLKKKYDRVVFIDADILIRDDAPDLFEIVSEDKFGVFNEGQFTPRSMCLHEAMQVYGVRLPKWNGRDYYNTGVMVVSKKHRHIFKPPGEIKQLRNAFGEQTFLNFRLFENETEVHNLDYKLNSMSIMARLTGFTRLDSYFVHYAGWERDIFEDIDRDIEMWKSKDYDYKRNIFMFVGGGIGDQVCSEPVLRYMKEELYPDANIFALTSVPRLFDHLDIKADRKYPEGEFDAMHEMNAHPSQVDHLQMKLIHPLCHPVDYISTACIGRILPDEFKTPKLTYSKKDLKESKDICKNLKDLVLIHPGVGWPSKTFPIEWWQKVVDGISKTHTVGMIGKTLLIDGDGVPKHSYAPVECPENGYDFRDKLSLGGLIALLDKAKVLVSNDSAPVHLAGAFDNHIVLIPTCKHPDYVLPYRNGHKDYKTVSLCKKTLYDDHIKGYLITDLVAWHISECNNLYDYLPEPEEVIQTISFISH